MPPQTPAPSADELAARAYEAAFELDYDAALTSARTLVALAPDASRSHRVLAAVLWAQILFRTGATTVDYFLGSLTKSKDTRPPIPPDVEREFEAAVTRAIELAERRLDDNRNDVDARYEAGAAYAIQASFRASIGGSLTAAFGAARQAYKAQEGVLDRVPGHAGANVIAGTYRYAVSGLRFPSRWFAYLAGFSGDGERGIRMLETAAERPGSVYDALPALLLIYAREGRHEDAHAIAERLSQTFPRNRFFRLEVGSAALRAGRPGEAERIFREGLIALDADVRPKAPGERAFWLYKHAAALVELGRPADAADLVDSAFAANPAGWVEGRLYLERGKIADLAGRRDAAVDAYRLARSIAARDDDPMGRKAAEILLEQPFARSGLH